MTLARFQMCIGGEWVDALSGKTFDSLNPALAEPWAQLPDADEADVERALAEKPDWLNMTPSYLRMVNYTYQWLGAYFRQPEPREAIYILVGDHQPAANITGEGASWDVPVHIVSRDKKLLADFIKQGFQAGMEPPRQALGDLHVLADMMLKTFATPVTQLAKVAR